MENRRRLLSILLVVVLLLLVACGSGGEEINYVTYGGETAVIAFEYPANWAMQESEGQIIVASTQELIDSEEYAGGGVVNIFTGPANAFEGELVSVLNELVTTMTEEGATVTKETAAININGQNAAIVTLAGEEGSIDITMSAAVIVHNDQIAFVTAVYDTNHETTFGPITDRIINSVEIWQADN